MRILAKHVYGTSISNFAVKLIQIYNYLKQRRQSKYKIRVKSLDFYFQIWEAKLIYWRRGQIFSN